ncbi:hypothetical protein HPT25_04840 [Bacillus sp. BRMEA1]|uniref:hypothetical protein n=1 Tax=Neobacillus endophyticus TaxID=2738405 RepID=UPI001566105E|nr:hypothetical protein [Neobacillus endophyticus]NRD76818.1 hypothetical protein [Neobacillus endophyticus]
MNWHFDWNEGFMFSTSLIGLFVILSLRKHFDKMVFIIIWVYSLAFVETIDYSVAASPFRYYYCGDNKTYEPSAAAIQLFLYPCFSYLFLFFYERWNITEKKLIVYFLAWDLLSVFFEWINVINGVFTYTGWHLFYSAFVYPISCALLLIVYHFTKTQLKKPIQT